MALRCRIVLAAAQLGINRHTAALWRKRVAPQGIGCVWEIAAGRGRKPQYDQAKRDAIVEATLQTKPKGMLHWSCRLMVQAQGAAAARLTGSGNCTTLSRI